MKISVTHKQRILSQQEDSLFEQEEGANRWVPRVPYSHKNLIFCRQCSGAGDEIKLPEPEPNLRIPAQAPFYLPPT